MKSFSFIFLCCILCQGCDVRSEKKEITYQNIFIMSDLSDRVDRYINGRLPNQQYPPKDIQEIDKILIYFKEECVKPGEKIGDKSCISFLTFSDEPVVRIDIGLIDDLSAKQQFINSTGSYKAKGLDYQMSIFKQAVHNSYSRVRNRGLDLISVIVDKIENQSIVKHGEVFSNGLDTTFVNYDNHLYIFTDGYLEYKGKRLNGQFYFGGAEIDFIREYCRVNSVDVEGALTKNNSLCLPPVRNRLNSLVDLHIYETHERDKVTKFQTYRNPKGLRDNEILEAVWRKWAIESGFKSFEWKKY